jgi:hypothetical protein
MLKSLILILILVSSLLAWSGTSAVGRWECLLTSSTDTSWTINWNITMTKGNYGGDKIGII